MKRFLDFLHRRRIVVVFICLQSACWWLIVVFNSRYNSSFLNSSNAFAASVHVGSQNVLDYFYLKEINEQLKHENELLQKSLYNYGAARKSIDTVGEFSIIGGRVVNNTFLRGANFLTIDVGKKDSVFPGMGVISVKGIVGQIKSVSKNHASVYSLLHPKMMVSSTVKRTGAHCTVQWDQRIYNRASLKYVPRHTPMEVGDTIVTSGFNSVFPPGINIGVVTEANLEDHMTFYDANIRLSTDFTSLLQVFVILDRFKQEKDSLEML